MTAGFASPTPHPIKETRCWLQMAPISGLSRGARGGLQKAGVLIFSLCSGYRHSGGHFSFSLFPHLLEERGTLYVSWLYQRTVVGTHKEKDTKTILWKIKIVILLGVTPGL